MYNLDAPKVSLCGFVHLLWNTESGSSPPGHGILKINTLSIVWGLHTMVAGVILKQTIFLMVVKQTLSKAVSSKPELQAVVCCVTG